MKNKFVGKSHDKVVMNALAHAKNTEGRNREGVGRCCNSVNPIVQNALEYKRACNAKFKVGDKVRAKMFPGHYTVKAVKPYGYDIEDKKEPGRVFTAADFDLVADNAAVDVTGEEGSVACNASFKVGDVVGLPIMDGGRRDYVVIGTKGSGWYYVGKAEDPYVGQECVRFDAMKGKGRTVSVPKDAVINGKCDSTDTACNGSGIKVGDIVQVGYEPDNARRGIVGKTGEVLSQSSGFALLDIGGKEMFVQRSSLKIVNSACCENAVNLGMVTLKSPEAEEVQKLARTKGYAAAKKYCAEKKAEIEKVDGHRAWYFLDAALDAGKMAGMNSCCENAVPVDGSFTPMAYIKGMIKAIEANPSAKELEGGAWKVVRDKPNYKALASTAEYKKLDKMVGINSCGEEDACCNAIASGDMVMIVTAPLTGKWTYAKCGTGRVKETGVFFDTEEQARAEAKRKGLKVVNADCCNATFREGQRVTIRGIEKEDMPGTIVKKPQSGFPNTWWVSWRDVRTGAERSGVLPEKYLVANAEDMVCNFDPKTRGAQEVIKAIAAIPGGPSNLKRAQALAIQKKVGASDKDFDAALRFFQWDGIADVANEEAVCNSVGDCFSDATFYIEKAIKNPKTAKSELAKAKQEISGPYGVMGYENTAAYKPLVSKCVAAIDKAMSNPTSENLMAARWECEKGRAKADGGAPQKTLWS